jgi:hypothetical protein
VVTPGALGGIRARGVSPLSSLIGGGYGLRVNLIERQRDRKRERSSFLRAAISDGETPSAASMLLLAGGTDRSLPLVPDGRSHTART